jgi:hypothetical protein
LTALIERTDPSSLHRREATRAWWEDQLVRYDVWISEAVVLELEQGKTPEMLSLEADP